MSPANSDRFKREAFWDVRWFADAVTANLVFTHNAGTLEAYDPPCARSSNDGDEFDYELASEYYERPGTDPVPLSYVKRGIASGGEWLFRCESKSPMDLLHPGEIKFLSRYASEVFNPPIALPSKECFIRHWGVMAPFVAAFIGSTVCIDEACTTISERPHIGLDWSNPQPIATFLQNANDSWRDIHREAESLAEDQSEMDQDPC